MARKPITMLVLYWCLLIVLLYTIPAYTATSPDDYDDDDSVELADMPGAETIDLPDCSWLQKYSFRENLRKRLTTAINDIKPGMEYKCALEAHTALDVKAARSNRKYKAQPHRGITPLSYKAPKKENYKARDFIRDAVKEWAEDLKTISKPTFGCNYDTNKTYYFAVCYFE